MKQLVFALFMAFGLIAAHAADKDHREAKAHAHGHGKVNIVIEGNRLFVELEAPGSDIVGFEHAAKTNAEKSAVMAAKKKLQNAGGILQLPAAASCKSTKADVALHGEGGDHNEFHVQYEFVCDAISRLRQIEFRYFTVFQRAEELETAVVTAKGQKKFEATRKEPVIELGGLN